MILWHSQIINSRYCITNMSKHADVEVQIPPPSTTQNSVCSLILNTIWSPFLFLQNMENSYDWLRYGRTPLPMTLSLILISQHTQTSLPVVKSMLQTRVCWFGAQFFLSRLLSTYHTALCLLVGSKKNAGQLPCPSCCCIQQHIKRWPSQFKKTHTIQINMDQLSPKGLNPCPTWYKSENHLNYTERK